MFSEIMDKHTRIQDIVSDMVKQHPVYDKFKENPAYRRVYSHTDDIMIDVHILDQGVTANIPKIDVIPYKGYEFNSGDMIRDEDDDYWLCTVVNKSLGYSKGLFTLANTTLKWIDKEDNTLNEVPAVFEAKTLYTTGVKDEHTILVPNGMTGILVTRNEKTEQIRRNDFFIFNRTRYKVTFFDITTIKGVVALICEEFAVDSVRDDLVNEIANRYDDKGNDLLNPNKPEEPETPEEVEFAIDGEDIIYLGETNIYTTNKEIKDVSINKEKLAKVISFGDKKIEVKANNNYNIGNIRIKVISTNGDIVEKKIKVAL